MIEMDPREKGKDKVELCVFANKEAAMLLLLQLVGLGTNAKIFKTPRHSQGAPYL